MCAKKAVSTAVKKPAVNGKDLQPASAATKASAKSTKKPSTKSPPQRSRERMLSQSQIGEVAGEVWQLLATSDALTLAAVKKAIDAPADLVVAAVGWLGREDKIDFVTSGRTLKLARKL